MNVYVTGTSTGLVSAVNAVAPSGSVNYITVANTWSSLLEVQNQLEASLPSLQAQGIDISQFHTDPASNQEIIDVVGLTPDQTATLDQQFGASVISVHGVTASQVPTPASVTW
jgi:hypothetical protein